MSLEHLCANHCPRWTGEQCNDCLVRDDLVEPRYASDFSNSSDQTDLLIIKPKQINPMLHTDRELVQAQQISHLKIDRNYWCVMFWFALIGYGIAFWWVP